MAEGVLHETMNMAALWKLPLLLVCENNGWSEFSPTSRQFVAKLKDLAQAFNLRYAHADGNDALEVFNNAQELLKHVRSGAGTAVFECTTQRMRGHFEGDPQKYRDASELTAMDENDPVARTQATLLKLGSSQESLDKIDSETQERIALAIESARTDTEPSYLDALNDVYTQRAQG